MPFDDPIRRAFVFFCHISKTEQNFDVCRPKKLQHLFQLSERRFVKVAPVIIGQVYIKLTHRGRIGTILFDHSPRAIKGIFVIARIGLKGRTQRDVSFHPKPPIGIFQQFLRLLRRNGRNRLIGRCRNGFGKGGIRRIAQGLDLVLAGGKRNNAEHQRGRRQKSGSLTKKAFHRTLLRNPVLKKWIDPKYFNKKRSTRQSRQGETEQNAKIPRRQRKIRSQSIDKTAPI